MPCAWIQSEWEIGERSIEKIRFSEDRSAQRAIFLFNFIRYIRRFGSGSTSTYPWIFPVSSARTVVLRSWRLKILARSVVLFSEKRIGIMTMPNWFYDDYHSQSRPLPMSPFVQDNETLSVPTWAVEHPWEWPHRVSRKILKTSLYAWPIAWILQTFT